MGGLSVREGDFMIPHVGAQMDAATADFLRANPIPLKAATILARAALTGESLEVEDFEEPIEKTYRDRFGYRALLHTPMMAEGDCIGVLSIARREAGPFAQRQKDIIRSFAEQAAIAIRNLRLFKDLEARTAELNEALERQTATAETLKTLSRSAFDLDAVLDTLTQSAQALCGADTSGLVVRIDGEYRMRASNGMPPELEAILRKRVFAPSRDSIIPRVLLSGAVEIVPDAEEDPEFVYVDKRFPRSVLGVPLIRDGDILGGLVLGKFKAGGFTERQIELLKTYADQAVIAIGNVNLFKDLESRTAELNQALEQQTATAETLKTLSRSVFDLDAVLNTLVESAVALFHATSGGLALLTDGEYKMRSHIGYGPNAQKFFRESAYRPGRDKIVGRVLLSREVEMIRDTRIDHELMKFADPGHDARSMLGVPLFRDGDLIGVMVLRRKEAGGDFSEREIGMVKTFADQAVIAIGNAQLFKDLEARTAELARSLQELRATQHRLIQTEKLASLGQLTAGVAHEIKNPLNFVNNFSKLSVELLGELGEALQSAELPQSLKDEVKDLSQALADNMGKIHHHGQRADSIVKNMLLHARQDGGERRAIDLNALIEESLNLAYHGARVERRDFTIELLRDLDPAVGQLVVCPQELTRVLLNLFSNGFYAAFARAGESGFTPSLRVSTKCHENRIEIRVRDNGNGIPEAIREKLFTPFFTTKPAGEGTGLGLSLSHDIILKQHGGALSFESEAGLFTEFLITLPRDVNEARRP
jgi:signal transduction histidine kinase